MNEMESLDMKDQSELEGQLQSFPGHLLREAREDKGFSQKEAARDLHLTSKVINAIEEDDFTLIPSHVFARGYIRSYARHVGLDGQALVAAFDEVYGIPNHKGKPKLAIRKPSFQSNPSDTWVKVISVLFVAGLVAASIFWWQSQNGMAVVVDDVEEEIVVATANDELLDLSLLQSNDAEVEGTLVAQPSAAPELVIEPAETAQQTDVQTVTQESEIALEPEAPVPEKEVDEALPAIESASVLAPGEGALYIMFVADCWVEIKDANGKMVLSDLYTAGDVISEAVAAPVELLLGRSSAVGEITFDGMAVDLEPNTRKDIARVTLTK